MNIEPVDQVLDLAHLEWTGEDHERVGTLIGHDTEIGIGALCRRGYYSHSGTNKCSCTPTMHCIFARRHNLFDLLSQIIGKCELERNHRHVLLHALHIEAADDAEKALHK